MVLRSSRVLLIFNDIGCRVFEEEILIRYYHLSPVLFLLENSGNFKHELEATLACSSKSTARGPVPSSRGRYFQYLKHL